MGTIKHIDPVLLVTVAKIIHLFHEPVGKEHIRKIGCIRTFHEKGTGIIFSNGGMIYIIFDFSNMFFNHVMKRLKNIS